MGVAAAAVTKVAFEVDEAPVWATMNDATPFAAVGADVKMSFTSGEAPPRLPVPPGLTIRLPCALRVRLAKVRLVTLAPPVDVLGIETVEAPLTISAPLTVDDEAAA